MTRPTPSRRRPLAAVLACTLAAAACTDQPAAPEPRAATPALSSGTQPQLVSNAIRYSDSGQKPATGREGSASLTVTALLDDAGITHVDVVSGTQDEPGTGLGTLDQVKLKAFVRDSADDALVNTFHRIGSGRWSYQVAGPVRGTPLQVQAAVSGIDASRTDVVTVNDTVLLAPDLRVQAVGPDRVRAGVPVVVAALIDERNGDVGASADCVLYVDGAAVDQAERIWVDARGSVYCIFTHTFADPGERQVEIRAENVSPVDYDGSNNAAVRTLHVADANSFSYNAAAFDSRGEQSYYNRRRWTDAAGASGEDRTEFSHVYADQYAYMNGWRAVGLALPVRARLDVSSDGSPIHATVLDSLGAGHSGGDFCSYTFDRSAGARFHLCTRGDSASGYTSFQYQRMSTAISYHSLNYSARWDPQGTLTYVYSYNYSFGHGATPPPYGTTFSFLVELTDADGRVYPTSSDFTLNVFGWNNSVPLQCNTVDDWYYDVLEYCWSRTNQYTARNGSAYQHY